MATFGELFAGGEFSGLFVGWFLDDATAAALALDIEGAVPASELHVTVAYAGKVATADDLDVMRAIENARSTIEYSSPFAGSVTGVARFQGVDTGQDAIVALVDVKGLARLNDELRGVFIRAGLEDSEHGYIPHITLAYVPSGADMPITTLPALPLVLGAMTINAGTFSATVTIGAGMAAAVYSEAVDANGNEKGRLFIPQTFSEDNWINYLPLPGVYEHARYGKEQFTAERNKRFVEGFKSRVYQQHLPIDAEHQTKLSGAVGWIEDMRQNDDGSVDARIDWTERGKTLLQKDAFRYFSPEIYHQWTAPTGETYTDVAVGGAITTRPYFKESSLRPLAASEEPPPTNPEEGHMADDVGNADSNKYAELSQQFAEEKARGDRLEAEAKQYAEQNLKLTETVDQMQSDMRVRAFREEVRGRSDANNIRWFGDENQHVAMLEKLTKAFGENSDEVKAYIDQNREAAKRISASGIFSETGSRGISLTGSDAERLDTAVQKYREAHPDATPEQAKAQVYSENPDLVASMRAGKTNKEA
ncbi:MAG: phage protease [Vicinamibacterales bacterium]